MWDASIVLAKYIEKARREGQDRLRVLYGPVCFAVCRTITPSHVPPPQRAAGLLYLAGVWLQAAVAPAAAVAAFATGKAVFFAALGPATLQNSRRGDFSRAKVRGRRVLELGAGMGLAGMAMALLGCGE